MDEFKEKFLEEAEELLESLENALLNLEKDIGNKEYINEIFRVVHSLKGTGSMFGFNRLSEFAHELESIYALVRSDKLSVSKALIDITLDSVDVLKGLISESEQEDAGLLKKRDAILDAVKTLAKNEEEKKENANLSHDDREEGLKTWYVHFEPDKDIMKDGTNPLYMIEEVNDLGRTKVWANTDNIPSIEKINPTECYVFWDILIVTEKKKSEIEDIFLFVQDESNLVIKKVAGFNIFEKEALNELLSKFDKENAFDSRLLMTEIEKVSADSPSEEPKTEKKEVAEPKAQKIQKPAEVHKPVEKDKDFKALQTIRVSFSKLDRLMDLVSELVTTQARLEHFNEKIQDPELESITESYQKLSRQLRESVLDMRLIPVNNMIHRFKKLVRDLANDFGKEIDFITKGTDTELDKSIIEKLTDPVMHIIRNSIDHGIESPEERERLGKPRRGTILFEAYYEGSSIVIKISDDGKGIDTEKVKAKALQSGIITNGDIPEKELQQLIFHPGFSTADKVTGVSGRGVGMDVVKKNILDLRGEIELESERGKGTVIKIILPLTLSIIDGLLVSINDNKYIIQLDNILRIYEVTPQEIDDSFDNILTKDNKQIPFLDLTEQFHEEGSRASLTSMIVLFHEDREVGILVNKILGKYQAVIKPLGKQFQQMEIFSGASILGDGSIALVIDTSKLFNNLLNQ